MDPCWSAESGRTNCRSVAAVLLAVVAGLWPASATPQQFEKPVRIGVLTAGWGPTPALSGLLAGLQDLGYRENEDFVVGVEFTQGDGAALPASARALVARGVDILVPMGPLAAEAAQLATATHPIVFVGLGDPIGRGLVDSFPRPGGNVTGVTDLNFDAIGKRLQLFRELVPEMKRLLFVYSQHNQYHVEQAAVYRTIAQQMGIDLVERMPSSPAEAQALMSDLSMLDIDGMVAPRDVDLNIPGLIIEASTRENIPSMFDLSIFVEEGGLASYGGSPDAGGRQAARLVHEIILGTAPSELPVETVRLEFVINLTVAARLGIAVPFGSLLQADRLVN